MKEFISHSSIAWVGGITVTLSYYYIPSKKASEAYESVCVCACVSVVTL